MLAAVLAPTAVFFAVGGDVRPVSNGGAATVVAAGTPCCPQVVAPASGVFSWTPASEPARLGVDAPVEAAPASRWRAIDLNAPSLLPVGLAPEAGLQVKTILVSRTISVLFPEIQNIGGVRPDALRWHPNGLALDVMIPNPGSAEGIALGDAIVAFALKNAERFALQDAIWRGVYYTPGGARSGGYGHYDHVHITTTGGGYPTGGEVYIR